MRVDTVQTLMASGTPEELHGWLAHEAGWPNENALPAEARHATLTDLPDEDGDSTESLIVEVLDAALKVLDRVVL